MQRFSRPLPALLGVVLLATLLPGCATPQADTSPAPTTAVAQQTPDAAQASPEPTPPSASASDAATSGAAPSATVAASPTPTAPPPEPTRTPPPTATASPESSPTSAAPPQATLPPSPTLPPERTEEVVIYRARPGDTFSVIAARADIPMNAMLALNNLSASSVIRVGQPLELPPGALHPEHWPVGDPAALPTFTTDTPIAGSPEIKLGRDDQKWISLTFDTGYNPEVQREILAILREYGIKATFLFVGNGVEQAPEVVSDVLADGHELGNHSFTHRSFLELSPDQVLAELRNTEAAVKAVDPNATTKPWLRTPFGHTNEQVRQLAHQEGYYVVNWTVDSIDWVPGITAEEVYWTMNRAIRPGAIIVQHGSSKASVVALQRIIPELLAAGYEFKTLSEITAP